MSDKNKVVLTNPVQDELADFVKKLKSSSKSEETRQKTTLAELRDLLVKFMEQDKTDLAKDGWTSKILRNKVYQLAEYESSKKDKYGQSMAIKSFETKVGRAVKDAVLLFYAVNPTTEEKNDTEKGYQLNDNGEMCLPYSTLKPEISDSDLKGQKVPNDNHTLVAVIGELREGHFAQIFPDGTRQSAKGQGKTDFEKVVIELNQYLIKLNNEEIIDLLGHDTKSDFAKHLETLENTIGKVFEKNSGLALTSQGNVVDTTVKIANKK